jgi:carnitine 3-dehydrogenase
MIPAADIHRVAVVGAGALGAGWVTLALHHGLDVVAIDPRPQAEVALRDAVERQRADLQAVTPAGPDARLTVHRTLDAAADADLVIESGPEVLGTKHEIVRSLDAVTRPDVLLCSSSSGLMPSDIQQGADRHRERVLVTHPFNPTHLMPLVEVVGGRLTSEDAVTAALEAMRRLGKQPVRIDAELPGHVVNRLQAALWREAYHLVGTGAVSVADLDAAVAAGPGLRWALLGPFATQHLSGLPAGIAHILDHLGPPMEAWWDDLGAPRLTDELVRTVVSGVDDELGGVDVDDLVRRRDAALRELLVLRDHNGLSTTRRSDDA